MTIFTNKIKCNDKVFELKNTDAGPLNSISNSCKAASVAFKLCTVKMVIFLKNKWRIIFIGLIFVQLTKTMDTCSIDQVKESDELIFAQAVCRHGDRNIVQSYKNDPWKSEEFWPGGFGQLTQLGKRQEYALGQYIRERYKNLLGNGKYSVEKVYVHSSDSDRVLMSALAALAGLFPPIDIEIWNEAIHWQPIPVHTEPIDQDYLIVGGKKCDRFDYEMIKYENSTEYQELFIKYKSLIEYLRVNSGEKLSSLIAIAILRDTLLIEKSKGYCLPSWAENVIQPNGDFEDLTFKVYLKYTVTTELKKLRTGYLLKEILNRFSNKLKSTLSPDRSLWLYFGHDLTIVSMLNSLGVKYTPRFPPMASCLFFELYRNYTEIHDKTSYVQLFYRHSANTYLSPLEISNCGTKCPLEKWYKLYDDILPQKRFDDECKLENGESLSPQREHPKLCFLDNLCI